METPLFTTDKVGQFGHKADSTPVIDGAELKKAHSDAASRSEQHEATPGPDHSGDPGKYTRSSDDLRHEIEIHDKGPTYATAQENSNIRGSK
jgi:hypothetical protein